MSMAPPSADLKAGFDEIDAKMTKGGIEAAGDAGIAIIDAYRSAQTDGGEYRKNTGPRFGSALCRLRRGGRGLYR